MDYDRTPVGLDTTDDRLDGDEVYCPRCGGSFSPLVDLCPDDGTRLIRWQARPDPLLGATIDRRFRIVGAIGEGAMGRVYEAVDLARERAVAIKVIREPLSRDRATAKRFLREARLLAGFDHPHIVEVHDYGQTDAGALFLVMELLRGRTLADELRMARRLSPARAIAIAVQLCDALAAAHERGVIHRDLKPVNVLLCHGPRETVKVLDFGLAKSLTGEDLAEASTLTQTGAILGTPLYMAPEALAGGADARSDLYALGCVVYEMLAGAPPFVDPAINVVLARHLAEPPPPLPGDVPPALAAAVLALLEKAPEQRPPTAHAARNLLLVALPPPGGPAPHGSGVRADVDPGRSDPAWAAPPPVAPAARARRPSAPSTIKGPAPAPPRPDRVPAPVNDGTRWLWLWMFALVTGVIAMIVLILWASLA
jgi:serine/threonine-protein kinase